MRALIAAAALACATSALAKEAELPVEVPEGASWTVETLRTRTAERDGKPTRAESRSRYRATYRSLKGGGGLLTLRLLDGGLPEEMAGISLEAFERPLELEVDESLTPVRLRNWPEYRDALFRIFEALEDEKGAKRDPKAVEAVKDMFRKIPDDQAHGLMAPAFNYISLGQGLALEPRKPFKYDGEQPNPIGGTPIKTRAAYVLESLDRKGGRAVIVWTQTLDPVSMRAAVLEIVKPLLAKAAKPEPGFEAQIDQVRLTRDDRCRFEIHVPTGLATKVECVSTLGAAVPGETPFQRTDAWTITQTLPEPR